MQLNDLNIPESVRERIKKAIEEGAGQLYLPPEMKHLLTSICFLMYTHGYDDAFRLMEQSIKVQKELFKGK